RRNEDRQGRKSLRLRPGWFVDHLTARQTSRDDHSAEAPAQFCLGRCRWENALPLREERTLPDEIKHRRRKAMSNAASESANASASPLCEGERIEVRGFSRCYRKVGETLTLPSPLGRERRMAGGDL